MRPDVEQREGGFGSGFAEEAGRGRSLGGGAHGVQGGAVPPQRLNPPVSVLPAQQLSDDRQDREG